jgi:FkbM family methyltransferase
MMSASRFATAVISRLRRPFAANTRLAKVLSNHLPPSVCVDVGASYYPHRKWDLFIRSPATRWIAVEPNFANADYVRTWPWRSTATLCPTGLSREGGKQKLHVTNVDSGSSLLPPVIPQSMMHRVRNHDYFFPVRELEIDTLTLMQVVDGVGGDAPVFVKLDTQGTELSILQGAEPLLRGHRIAGIELESTMLAQPIMQGSGKFWQVCQYLEDLGYELLHVKPIHGGSRFGKSSLKGLGFLNECDSAFALRRDVALQMPPGTRAGLLVFYLSYRLFEEALSLLDDDAGMAGLLRDLGCDIASLRSTIDSVA